MTAADTKHTTATIPRAARLSSRVEYTGPGPGSYSPQAPSSKHISSSGPGSSAFCATGRNVSAAGAASSSGGSRGSSAPGPGSHGLPRIAHTGADLAWASPDKPGAAAAFKAPARSATASAALLRERLQQQKFQGGQQVPWLLSPPQHTTGRPLPGPRKVQSAHPRVMQDQQQRSAARAALGGVSSTAPQSLGLLGALKPLGNSSSSLGRSWQPLKTPVPGPGSYDLLKYTALQDNMRSHRSPAFMQLLATDRFCVSALHRSARQQHSPQPTQQQQQQQRPFDRQSPSPPSSRQPGVSAGFRSRSPGHTEALMAAVDGGMIGAPGPSYYSPQQPPVKVSHRQAGCNHTFTAAV